MTQLLDGRYELGPRVGAGGMSEVFEGYDRNLGRRVAVKFLKADVADPRARERFEHEARAAASFTHPNAVSVYDIGEVGTRPYIVMELVEGRNLAEVLSGTGPLPVREAVQITDQMLAALGAAHARGVVHRDVKPGNVLVAANGSVKLADFGIAKAVSDASGGLTMTGQVMGTPKYLAPEQAAGQATTARSDLYATGVVLYEMLAGAPPFEGDTPVAIALAHQQAPVPPLTRRPGLPAALVATVHRALEKDPARRFPSAEAMRATLASGPGETPTAPVTATPTHALRGDGRPPRRRRWPWAALGLLALAGALLVAWALVNRDAGRGRIVSGEPATTTSTTTTTTSTTTTATPPTTISRGPQTIGELIAPLARDPDAFGEKGNDLLKKLEQVQQKQDGKEAAKLVEEIDKWVGEGKLDPQIGSFARKVLL